MKTRYEDIQNPNCERRDFATFSYRSRFGRSTVKIECPFCGDIFIAYLWSFAGCGKRCDCGALFSSLGAYKLKENDDAKI